MKDFTQGDQIRLKIERLCYLVGTTTTVLILPNYLLTYVRGNDKHCHFKVSFDKDKSEVTRVNNGDVVRISKISFENLKFDRL
jgi:hypothetical protein